MLTRRFPDAFPTGDGNTSDSNVFEWVSDDGGATFSGPAMLGDNAASDAIVFGGPDKPQIATITRTQTTGTEVQTTSAGGNYERTGALIGKGDQNQDYDGDLAVDGDRPIAVFANNTGTSFIREYSGSGDINDSPNWTPAAAVRGLVAADRLRPRRDLRRLQDLAQRR